jgi:hypothetical protein
MSKFISNVIDDFYADLQEELATKYNVIEYNVNVGKGTTVRFSKESRGSFTHKGIIHTTIYTVVRTCEFLDDEKLNDKIDDLIEELQITLKGDDLGIENIITKYVRAYVLNNLKILHNCELMTYLTITNVGDTICRHLKLPVPNSTLGEFTDYSKFNTDDYFKTIKNELNNEMSIGSAISYVSFWTPNSVNSDSVVFSRDLCLGMNYAPFSVLNLRIIEMLSMTTRSGGNRLWTEIEDSSYKKLDYDSAFESINSLLKSFTVYFASIS